MATVDPTATNPLTNPPPLDAATAQALGAVPQNDLEKALEDVRAELNAMPDAELIPINLDARVATVAVLGLLPKLRAMRAEMAQLHDFDIRNLDSLETYALAATQATNELLFTSGPVGPIPELVEELTKHRELLVSDAHALVKRGVLDGAPLDKLRGATGHQNMAFDVMVVCGFLKSNWAAVNGKIAVTRAEVERLHNVATQLFRAVAARDHSPAAVSAAAALRHRAFTRFMKAYDQVRRAVGFLRWESGDADRLAPTLYTGRSSSRRKNEPEVPQDPAPAPAPPTPTPVAQPVAAPAPVAGQPSDSPFDPA